MPRGADLPPAVVRRHVEVHGRVQMVGFRMSCARRARAAAVAGWVRNRSDGTVEAVFEGDLDAVTELIAWCHHGPGMAVVEKVRVTEESPEGETGFAIR
jgi:acylphosphatase